jgi:transcription elongation factor GreA
MNSEEPTYLTPEGKAKLEEELRYLETEKRKELAERLHIAVKQGDLSENADYIQTKEEQGFIEGRIQTLHAMLRNVALIEEQASDRVRIGSKITVREDGEAESETFLLVGAAEADPAKGRISNESPLGSALLDRKVGDKVTFQAPRGDMLFEIVRIE